MSDISNQSDKAGAQILDMIRLAVPLDKLTPTTRLKQSKDHEPSPASTLGDSATDSSNPATPQDSRVRDLTKSLSNLLVTDIDDARSQQRLVLGAQCLMLEEPSPVGSLENKIDPRSTPSSSPHPKNQHHRELRSTSQWGDSHSSDFVLSSGNKDDPFITSTLSIAKSSKDSTATTYNVREDRAGDPPTPGTAQAHFSPDACVFVANLLQSANDQQLEQAVTLNFSRFGRVYVKIRRDGRGMPFAFAQYETEDEAQRAVTQGRNLPILGRHCRTEIAKVNRTLYLSRIAGGEISHEEARDVLKDYGAIEELHYASSTDRALYGLPQGIFVRFHFYDDCRDAQIKFRIHDGYRLEQPRVSEDVRSTMITRSAPRRSLANSAASRNSPSRFSPQSPTSVGMRGDDCSIFVGNLPPNVNEPRMHEHFAAFGRILSVVICPRPFGIYSVVPTAFAFIEFSTRSEAAIAVQRAPRVFGNQQLRIEHRAQKRPFMSHGGSPSSTNKLENQEMPGQTQDMIMMVYQRGVEAGINQATHAQAVPPHVMTSPIYASFQPPYYPSYDSAVGMFTSPNGAPPPTYGLGLRPYHSGNVTASLDPAEYLSTSAIATYVQPDQDNSAYAHQGHSQNEDLAYAWPLPTNDQGNPGQH